jgi:hypothetical protein
MTTSPDDHNPGNLPDLESLANQFPEIPSAAADAHAAELASVEPIELLRRQAARAVLAEAEDAAQGWRAVTIAHGDIDSAAESAAVEGIVRHARSLRPNIVVRGGCDYLTILIPPPDADDVAAHVAELARADAVGYWWWHVALSSRPARA